MAIIVSAAGTPSLERATSEFDRGTSKREFRLAALAATVAAPAGLAARSAVQAAAKPLWRFTVKAGITTKTTQHYRGFAAANQLVIDQLWRINRLFNRPDVFNGRLKFEVTRSYYFSGDPGSELQTAHPEGDYLVVYDGFPPSGGGWHAEVMGIHHYWGVGDSGGTFGSAATHGLAHEFGHARGAVDLYKLRVDGALNPINGVPFRPARSIMNEAYGVDVWDDHSVNLINKTADQVALPSTYLTEEFPARLELQVTDRAGRLKHDAEVKLYPIEWGSAAVTAAPLLTGRTDAAGIYALPRNPFGPGSSKEFGIEYPNFLVTATSGSATGYIWLPMYEVQNFAFANGRASTYRTAIAV